MTLLAVALDTPDAEQAVAWAREVGPQVDVMKIGLELFVSAGPSVVAQVADAAGRPIFLDLKLDDIPATVAGAARSAARLGIAWLTVHVGAGSAALEAAVEAVHAAGGDPPKLLGVTLLTSLGPADLKPMGLPADLEGVIDKRARLAAACGLDGVVCAGVDLSVIAAAAPALLTVVPGVRLPSAGAEDQSRVVTPAAAAAGGATMVVVGRPITRESDPARAAAAIREQLASAQPWRR